jgi:hypothetical protein
MRQVPAVAAPTRTLTALDLAMSQHTAGEWRIEKYEEQVPSAVLRTRGIGPEFVHLLLILGTAGFWLVPYLVLQYTRGVRRISLRLDSRGRVVVSPMHSEPLLRTPYLVAGSVMVALFMMAVVLGSVAQVQS